MEKLNELLAIVQALDPDNRGEEEGPPSDAELAEAREALVEHLKAAADGDDPDIEAARSIRNAIDSIDAETQTRVEAKQEAAAEAKRLLDGVTVEDTTEDEDGDDGEPEAEAEVEADDREKVLTASLTDAISRANRRATERIEPPEPRDVLVAAVGPAQGRHLDADSTLDDAAMVFNQYAGQVSRGSSVLIHMERLYPENRQLGVSAVENTRTIDAVVAPRAITAAGGICEPLAADFSHPICGDRGRPLRDALPSFRADRGGARFAPSATVADLEGGITVWTADNDASPSSPATKACPRVDCEDELEARVDAIVACLTVGNFQARFNPEFWRSRLDLLMIAHDRAAEQTIHADMVSGSTAVTYTGGSGTVVDVLEALDKAAAGLRSRHRLIGTSIRVVAPSWLRDALRANLAGQRPSGSLDLFSAADAQINQFFASRMITPIWSPDVDEFGTQTAGTLEDFPGGDVEIVVYPEGTWVFFDGGTLDLGTNISDSTLNAANDRQAFLETFEKVVQRGCESLAITIPVEEACICPDELVS